MENPAESSCFYDSAINLIAIKDYRGAIKEIKRSINLYHDDNDLAFAYLNIGFLNFRLKDYSNAVDDFSQAIYYENKIDILHGRSKDISLNARSNARFKCNDFKGAIDDKRMAKKVRLLEEIKILDNEYVFFDYKCILLGSFDKSNLDPKYFNLFNISRLDKSKYDLIEDYKKVINDKKKQEVIKNLEKMSDSKYNMGDYKGSIIAIRRSEKYYF